MAEDLVVTMRNRLKYRAAARAEAMSTLKLLWQIILLVFFILAALASLLVFGVSTIMMFWDIERWYIWSELALLSMIAVWGCRVMLTRLSENG